MEFASIRESRIQKERTLIEQRKELDDYKIDFLPTTLGLTVRVSILISVLFHLFIL
jgi:ubiquitin-protein ligase